jgi:hypothetical protein
MRSPARLAAIAAIALALVAIVVARADARDVVIRAAIVVAGLGATASLLRRSGAVTAWVPGRFEALLGHRETASDELPGLRSIDAALRMSIAHALGVEILLRRLVRDLARWRLRQNRGIDLEAEPARARIAAGETIWQLIRPDPGPATGQARLSSAAIAAIIDDLERIA